jgi:hypothetical protein
VLIRLGRHEAPVLAAQVDEPVFLLQGIRADTEGRPVAVRYLAVDGLPAAPRVRPMEAVLAEAAVGPQMPNPGLPPADDLNGLLAYAIEAARAHLVFHDGDGATGEPLLRVLAVLRKGG